MATEIPLTRGYVAIVDDEDAERVLAHKWHALVSSRNQTVYAKRTERVSGRVRAILMHRFLMDAPDGVTVDHKNRNGLDNRRSENLRFANAAQQQANSYSRSASGYRGVYEIKPNCFQARIKINGKNTHISCSRSPEVAARAYDDAAREAFGEFATLNFPEAA